MIRFEDLGPTRCALQGELTFATAYQAYSDGFRRIAALERGSCYEVDCAGIIEADSAGLSVLIEWKGEATRRGATLVYLGLPAAIERLARISEVDALIKAA
ncbi:MAG: STAS domain-containing protein [Steroidobacteraceae bacterium]